MIINIISSEELLDTDCMLYIRKLHVMFIFKSLHGGLLYTTRSHWHASVCRVMPSATLLRRLNLCKEPQQTHSPLLLQLLLPKLGQQHYANCYDYLHAKSQLLSCETIELA